jgi:hypothetical protein
MKNFDLEAAKRGAAGLNCSKGLCLSVDKTSSNP